MDYGRRSAEDRKLHYLWRGERPTMRTHSASEAVSCAVLDRHGMPGGTPTLARLEGILDTLDACPGAYQPQYAIN